MEAQAELSQKLDFITPGLRAKGSLAFDFFFENNINRSKNYIVYEYKGDNDETGEPIFETWGQQQKQNNSNSYGAAKTRIFDVDLYLGRSGIDGILDQLLHHGSRSLNDLSGGNLIGYRVG